jgi:hypothetical protein
VNDQSVQEVPQQLVTALFVVGMVLFAKDGTQLIGRDFKIDKGKDFYDIVIPELKGDPQFF